MSISGCQMLTYHGDDAGANMRFHFVFDAEEVTLGQAFNRLAAGIPLISIIPPLLHIHLSTPLGAPDRPRQELHSYPPSLSLGL